MTDPRTILDEASRQRTACQLQPREGVWTRATFVRVDRAGVILTTEERLAGGEDVRVWFRLDDQPYTFQASVLRAGIPVPDRSPNGILLGFITEWQQEAPRSDERFQIEVLPPTGKGVELFGSSARLVDLGIAEMAFAVPSDVALKFVEGSQIRVRFTTARGSSIVTGRIRRLAPGDGHLLYGLIFEEIPSDHLEVVAAFRSVLG